MTPGKPGEDFLREISRIRRRIGTLMLTDEDLVVLLSEEISKTTTREEKRYSSGKNP